MTIVVQSVIWSLVVWIASQIFSLIKIPRVSDAFAVAAIFGVMNYLFEWSLSVVFSFFSLGYLTGISAAAMALVDGFVFNGFLLKATDGVTDRIEVPGTSSLLAAAVFIALFGNIGEMLICPLVLG